MIDISHQSITPEAQMWQRIIQVVGLIATVSATKYITKVPQKALAHSVITVGSNQDQTKNYY